jgi:BirA family biotin operon repressor/biotin-[acetyl-CoA-carboxylase] ligase
MDRREADRSPLEPGPLARAAGPDWSLTLLPTVASTNEAALANPVPRRVIVADHQTAGRGRLDRTWVTPAGTALTFSAVVRPDLPGERWPLLPLAAGLAVADAVRRSGLEPVVKWPNDLLIGGRKTCGILVERAEQADGAGPVAVIGIGINVAMTEAELPLPTATSLAIEGATVDRVILLGQVLEALDQRLDALQAAPDDFVATYRDSCDTVGREVDVLMPDGSLLHGTAHDVDEHGRLVVRVDQDGGTEDVAVGAGDVVHVRPGQ